MSLGLLFGGQGSQHADMLRWLAHDTDPASALLTQTFGAHWHRRLDDPAWIRRNDVAQALLTGLELAAWQRLAPALPPPSVIAGYSAGELAAAAAAGVFDAGTAMRLATQRAALMDDCVKGLDTALLSLAGAGPGLVERLCDKHGLAVAIDLGAHRWLLGGLRAPLLAAEREGNDAGAACRLLDVPLASHTPWLADGVARWAAALEAVPCAAPRVALVVGFSGRLASSAAAWREAQSRQIAATVQWRRCLDTVAERGVRCVLEIGPGSALARQWSERFPEVPARSVDEFAECAGVVRWVAQALAPGHP